MVSFEYTNLPKLTLHLNLKQVMESQVNKLGWLAGTVSAFCYVSGADFRTNLKLLLVWRLAESTRVPVFGRRTWMEL